MQLERENRELRRPNEILKSAAAFFGAERHAVVTCVATPIEDALTARGRSPVVLLLDQPGSPYCFWTCAGRSKQVPAVGTDAEASGPPRRRSPPRSWSSGWLPSVAWSGHWRAGVSGWLLACGSAWLALWDRCSAHT